jgi:lipopolysaccharide/colanic/teichoic acid biosynthesis glycosyltransferase
MYKKYGKRIFDFVLAVLGLIIFLPVLIIAALAIKSTSKGPIFFKQERMGKDGKIFRLIKFRTMYMDPEEDSKQFSPGEMQRVTGVGRLLRWTKIDELPELINVIKGEMSLVGPRPEVPKYRPYYSNGKEKIFCVKPGITDWASIKYRNEEQLLAQTKNPEQYYINHILPDKLELNLRYINTGLGFREDLKIILATLRRILILQL